MSTLAEFYEGGPRTWEEAFPPICVKARYDPTLVTDHILPKFQHSMAYDPRPSTRICYSYKSLTQENPVQGPANPDEIYPVGGPAGRGFPYQQYAENVDQESTLLRLEERLTKCAERRNLPRNQQEVDSVGNHTIPGADFRNAQTLSPMVTQVQTHAGCREQDHVVSLGALD